MWELGVQVVVAAGNDGEDACFSTPAAAAFAVTVGASDSADSVAFYSNYGACVDVVAPGTSIASAASDRTFEEFEDFVNYGYTYDGPADDDSSEPGLTAKSGTSMATPAVAGVVALFCEALGTDTATDAGYATLRSAVTGQLSQTHAEALECAANDRLLHFDASLASGANTSKVVNHCDYPDARTYDAVSSYYYTDSYSYSFDGYRVSDLSEVGWCASTLDYGIEGISDPRVCWEACLELFPETVAADLYPLSETCYCQDACLCMAEATQGPGLLLTQDTLDALPASCDSYTDSYSYSYSYLETTIYSLVLDAADRPRATNAAFLALLALLVSAAASLQTS